MSPMDEGINSLRQAPVREIPQEVLDGGIRTLLRYLQDGKKTAEVPLARRVDDMREGGVAALSDKKSAVEEELNAITAVVIEKVWPEIIEVLRSEDKMQNLLARSQYVQRSDEAKMLNALSESLDAGLQSMETFGMNVFRTILSPHVSQRPDDIEKAVLDRMTELLKEPGYYRYKKDPLNLVMSGFGTASDMLVTLFAVIPHVYQQRSGHRPSSEEYRRIAESVNPLAQYLSSIRLDLLGSVLKEMRENVGGNKALAVANFEIREREGKLQLDLTQDALKKIAHSYISRAYTDLDPSRIQTGCQALYARGTDKKTNVISELHDWYYSMINEHYLKPREKAL